MRYLLLGSSASTDSDLVTVYEKQAVLVLVLLFDEARVEEAAVS